MIRIECACLCTKESRDDKVTEIPVFTLDEALQRSFNINIICKHLVKEHNSECLLSFIEFQQFERFILDEIYNSDVELMMMALKMRNELEVKNRKYKFKTHRRCITGSDGIEWLQDKINELDWAEAVSLFGELVRNGLLVCCTSKPLDERRDSEQNRKRKREHSLYRFLWDIVDVDHLQLQFQ